MQSTRSAFLLGVTLTFVGAVCAQGPRETQLYDSRHKGIGHGHQGVTTNGKQWFVFDTAKLYRYETDDFSADQAKLAVKNESPLSHPDFEGTNINHLGAPECWKGNVYTFAKGFSRDMPGPPKVQRMVWFSEKDLSYQGHLNLTLPAPEDGGFYNVSGGPGIVGDHFYSALVHKKDKEKLKVDKIGKFSMASGKLIDFVNVTRPYRKPQGIEIDADGNFYIISTNGGILKYDPTGKYLGVLFRNGGRKTDIHEGIHFDCTTNRLTMSVTKYRRKLGQGQTYCILQADLGKDIYRYVDAINGNDWNTGYSPEKAKKTIQEGMYSTVPGAVLRIAGYTATSPARESVRSGMGGWEKWPVVYEGHPDPAYITGSDDMSEAAENCKWKPSKSAGEYYLTADDGKARTQTEVRVLATATPERWQASGLEGVTERKKGQAGNLKPGQWDWADVDNRGFKTVYYRPGQGEDIQTVHIEAGQRDCPVRLDKPYNICRNIQVFLSNDGKAHRVTGANSRFE